MEVNYLETVTDPLVAQILAAYQSSGILDQTYVIIIADYGHTPVLRDPKHALGSNSNIRETTRLRPTHQPRQPLEFSKSLSCPFEYQQIFSGSSSLSAGLVGHIEI
jgi:hypothetical protein